MSGKIKDIIAIIINLVGAVFFLNARASVSGRIKEQAIEITLKNNITGADGLMSSISNASTQVDFCALLFFALAIVYFSKVEASKLRYTLIIINVAMALVYVILPKIS